MRYVSTRGAWADAPQPFSAILLEGLAPDGGLAVPEAYPRFTAAELDRAAPPCAIASSRSRCCRASSTTFPAPTSRRIIDRTYTKAIVRQRRDHAAARRSSRASTCCTCRTGRRSRSRTSRCSSSATCSSTRSRRAAARSTSSARRPATPAAPPSTRCAASAASTSSCCRRKGRMSPFQQAQMYLARRRQHPQHRDRRRVRRLPGHRQGGVRRRRVQGALPDRHGQFDQLGARRRAGRLLFQRLFRRDEGARRAGRLRGAVRQFRQHPRRTRRARRWACRSAG